MNLPRKTALVNVLATLWAMALCACLPMDERTAGSSTEAGNAGGKLSLADGSPAAGVSVSLVARNYLPDTLSGTGSTAGGLTELAGSYYRTRTGPDGRYRFQDVVPGEYRVLAIGSAGGAMTDSISVNPGEDADLVEKILKPLGGIRGVAKIVGSDEKVNIWVRPKATLKTPPVAAFDGTFSLDSLPEGEYELVPLCFTCQKFPKGYTVQVKAGKDTVLEDTLKIYPEYFFGFPDSGQLSIRSSWLPFQVGGKLHRGADDRAHPASVAWTWNGQAMASREVRVPDGIAETKAFLDSTLFSGNVSGSLKLSLSYPDTLIVREWRVALDVTESVWPLSAVEADSAVRIAGHFSRTVWRFHVKASRSLDSGAVAFWDIRPEAEANRNALPQWLDLAVEDRDQGVLGSDEAMPVTFILIPDAKFGGRIFRPRKNERLEDFGEIRFLEMARLGFPDSVEPSMLPGGLIADRKRDPGVFQRYRIDSLGKVEELLGPLHSADSGDVPPLTPESLLLFYRQGAAAGGFSWDRPTRDAAKVLAVTREGLAMRLDGSGLSATLSPEGLAGLLGLIAPLSLDPPELPDTCLLESDGTLEYMRAGGRGLARTLRSGPPRGTDAPADTLFRALRAWMLRNGLDEAPRFPLAAGTLTYLGFEADTSGIRYTGDTLVVELAGSEGSILAREYLSMGSPARAQDSAAIGYGLALEGDSLTADSRLTPVTSRLFGRIDGNAGVFPLTGLEPVQPAFRFGIPILETGSDLLSGRLEGESAIAGRPVSGFRLFLDGRSIPLGRQGLGFLHTPEGGLERAWRFGGRGSIVKGWDRK